MQSRNLKLNKIKSNNKGYTLIEVLIVVFMLV
ncbi:MAG: prepilin-type N-terminal cleavage/methylation domain-containing protein, partial [Clostridia bacterium]|nr:prepilin-type N-terminal cleavage/methylation domain-containing protein [Clostridia bacterium]